MTDLVVISLEAWDQVWRRNQWLISGLIGLDPTLRVLFVEPPADPINDMRNARPPSFARHARVHPEDGDGRLFTFRPVKWLPRRWDADADARLARAVARAAQRLGMRHPLLWINDPRAAVLSTTTGWPTLYDITDDWVVADRPADERERLAAGEQTLLRTAAEVVACSPELIRRKGPSRQGAPIRLVRNAVDVAAYRVPTARPADLPAGRTAVYVGTIHPDRFDVQVCIDTATALHGAAVVVLVGPLLLDRDSVADLRAAGVIALGPRARGEVIGYLQHTDVLLVPHLVDAFTDSLDPIKLYEYRAVGRPVVSTPVAGFRESDDPRVTIAERGGFAHTTRAVIDGATAPPERPIGPADDWADRVDAFDAILSRLSGEPRAGTPD